MTVRVALVAVALLALLVPASASAATCSDHSTQAAAQRAADTRDGDGDGIYCESLPCPCLKPGDSPSPPAPRPAPAAKPACVKTGTVQPIGFSRTRFATTRAHYLRAIAAGWPQVLVVNRKGADARRDRLLDESGLATMPGFDRDEYPPAVGRGRGSRALRRGINPVGWMASVEYVPSDENRSHGSTMGTKLRRFCDGQKFRYVFF